MIVDKESYVVSMENNDKHRRPNFCTTILQGYKHTIFLELPPFNVVSEGGVVSFFIMIC